MGKIYLFKKFRLIELWMKRSGLQKIFIKKIVCIPYEFLKKPLKFLWKIGYFNLWSTTMIWFCILKWHNYFSWLGKLITNREYKAHTIWSLDAKFMNYYFFLNWIHFSWNFWRTPKRNHVANWPRDWRAWHQKYFPKILHKILNFYFF